jgi:hypothetical protein
VLGVLRDRLEHRGVVGPDHRAIDAAVVAQQLDEAPIGERGTASRAIAF